eukprot:scaffold294600_cov10-Tisochrysis_lutea.AAC.1
MGKGGIRVKCPTKGATVYLFLQQQLLTQSCCHKSWRRKPAIAPPSRFTTSGIEADSKGTVPK